MFGTVYHTAPEPITTYEQYWQFCQRQYGMRAGQVCQARAVWEAARAAEVARVVEREGWISAQAAEILLKCPTGGWPGPRDGPSIPCSLEEARRRAQLAYMTSRAGVMVAVPPTGSAMPQEALTAALDVAPPSATPGRGLWVLAAMGAGLGVWFFAGKKKSRRA